MSLLKMQSQVWVLVIISYNLQVSYACYILNSERLIRSNNLQIKQQIKIVMNKDLVSITAMTLSYTLATLAAVSLWFLMKFTLLFLLIRTTRLLF